MGDSHRRPCRDSCAFVSFCIKWEKISGVLGLFGFALILFSIFHFDRTVLSPSYYLMVPTFGSVLVIIFCNSGSIVYKILGNRFTVFIGLLSYSLYLWHQPVFAYLRVYSKEHPGPLLFLIMMPLIFVFSYLSWQFVERPFRDRKKIRTKEVLVFSASCSALFVSIGVYLNNNYGMPDRIFGPDIKIEDMDKRIYNEKTFSHKVDSFSANGRKKILIIGNSAARDFVNITIENYDIGGVEIMYRDDLGECIVDSGADQREKFDKADVIVFASGGADPKCITKDIHYADVAKKIIYYIGPKNFGYNLNWLIRLTGDERRSQYNAVPDHILETELEMSKIIPPRHFISLLRPTAVDGRIPITDNLGRMLSTDRAHLTKYGAIYFGQKAVLRTTYSDIFRYNR